ncbi:MAG: shikimate dehydrogenase, partial [Thermoflexales bacterium]|nr:shikimate dehydrogenase [Thermoflexales bacterium]
MQNAAFAAVGLNGWRYELWETPPEALQARIAELRANGALAGANVTVPHKESVMLLLDELSAEARAVGAVNTVYKRNGALVGDNTDWCGFLADLAFHNVELIPNETALILGAGGSARAVAYALARQGIRLLVWNRTPARAEALLNDLAQTLGDMRGEVIPSQAHPAASHARLIVNCTSLGMWPRTDESPWQEGTPFPKGVVVYDLVYRPRRT